MSDKEKQIEEMAQVIFDYVDSKQMTRVFIVSNHANELAKPFLHNTGVAKALYNAGYRKTFTSDLASDTQKAYKEGYKKGVEDMQTECAICNRTNLKRIRSAVVGFADFLKEYARAVEENGYDGIGENDIDEKLKEYLE